MGGINVNNRFSTIQFCGNSSFMTLASRPTPYWRFNTQTIGGNLCLFAQLCHGRAARPSESQFAQYGLHCMRDTCMTDSCQAHGCILRFQKSSGTNKRHLCPSGRWHVATDDVAQMPVPATNWFQFEKGLANRNYLGAVCSALCGWFPAGPECVQFIPATRTFCNCTCPSNVALFGHYTNCFFDLLSSNIFTGFNNISHLWLTTWLFVATYTISLQVQWRRQVFFRWISRILRHQFLFCVKSRSFWQITLR